MEAWQTSRIQLPPVAWHWDFLGNEAFIIHMTKEVSWRKRLFTKIFFGSKWSRPLKTK